METKKYKVIVILSFIVFLINYNLKSKEYSAKIEPLIEVSNRVINMGPCLVNDSVFCNIRLINDGEKKLYMERLAPSFYLGASPNDETKFQFTLYRENTFLPKIFEPQEQFVFSLGFRAGDTLVTKIGWHEALLAMSFLREDTKQPPPVTPIDSFFVRVKKTLKHFDNFADVINFDSVYINTGIKVSKLWKGKNTTYKNITLKERKIKYITQPQIIPEFYIGSDFINLSVNPKGIIEREFQYEPLDKGTDSAYIVHYFVPEPTENPNFIDSVSVLLYGTGVEQKLEIIGSNYNFKQDTIFIDNINEDGNTIEIYFKNTGNLPIYVKNEDLIDLFTNSNTDEIKLVRKIQDDGFYLFPNKIDTVILELKPKKLGKIYVNYKLNTNLKERNIKGLQANTDKINFYIYGEFKSPRMILANNEIEFGDIILNRSDCPLRKDTTIKIMNTGNSRLIVEKVLIIPEYPDSPFFTNVKSLEIEPNQTIDFQISFETTSSIPNEYSAKIYFYTNEILGERIKTISVYAKTQPTSPIILYLPNEIKAKPGRQILVPIMLKTNFIENINLATNFSTDIIYDRSILEFIGTETLGTASEGTINKSDLRENIDSATVKIAFEVPINSKLKAKDTLIFLKFNTYLGNSAATNITMIEPKLGDRRCKNIFDMQILNGKFITDSVCGINYKIVKKLEKQLNLNIYYGENYSTNLIELTIPFKSNIILNVYDYQGNLIKNLINNILPEGVYQININEYRLNSGYYYITLMNNFQITTKPLIITR